MRRICRRAGAITCECGIIAAPTAPRTFNARLRAYWALIKPAQTGLLLLTGLAGLLSVRGVQRSWESAAGLLGSLALAISGSTLLNMAYDCDIDALMARTARRPLPMGRVGRREVVTLGLALSAVGVVWALALAPLYGLAVLAGLLADVALYTWWLKRRTPWSILWGGVAGGIPALAGRVLGLGHLDAGALLLALAVLLWIPAHILTLSLKRAPEYEGAGVPVLPNMHGRRATRLVIALSTAGMGLVMALAAWQVGLQSWALAATIGLGALLGALALGSALRPGARLDWALFKLASLYMAGAMALIILG